MRETWAIITLALVLANLLVCAYIYLKLRGKVRISPLRLAFLSQLVLLVLVSEVLVFPVVKLVTNAVKLLKESV